MRNAECGMRNAGDEMVAVGSRASRVRDLQGRTRAYALDVIRLVQSLPRSTTADVIGRQLLRCATSVGANYRAACRARSGADFIAKMGIVEEEAGECLYWFALLREAGVVSQPQIVSLEAEGNELLSIIVASIKTARGGTR